MFQFRTLDPFPLISHIDYDYELAKQHSVAVEIHFQLFTETAEKEHEKEFKDIDIRQAQAWVQLPIQTLMTPYLELRMILNDLELPEKSRIVDLGCAYGRMGFLIQILKLDLNFIGYEVSQARIAAAQNYYRRNDLDAKVLNVANLSDPNFKIPTAEAYFIYDYGSETEINKSLNQLKEIAKDKRIKVVGRGRRTRHLIFAQHPWLSAVNEPKTFDQYSIFYS